MDGCEWEEVHRINQYKEWEVLKSVLCNRGLRINSRRCLYGGVIVPSAWYDEELFSEVIKFTSTLYPEQTAIFKKRKKQGQFSMAI